jgi:hypothetical protein
MNAPFEFGRPKEFSLKVLFLEKLNSIPVRQLVKLFFVTTELFVNAKSYNGSHPPNLPRNISSFYFSILD